jgi:hypothetical protein
VGVDPFLTIWYDKMGENVRVAGTAWTELAFCERWVVIQPENSQPLN